MKARNANAFDSYPIAYLIIFSCGLNYFQHLRLPKQVSGLVDEPLVGVPPPLLAPASFLLRRTLGGSGQHLHCQVPATHRRDPGWVPSSWLPSGPALGVTALGGAFSMSLFSNPQEATVSTSSARMFPLLGHKPQPAEPAIPESPVRTDSSVRAL